MIVWVLLAIPAVLWWSESVLFVILISLYANVAGHFGAYQSAHAEKDNEERMNELTSEIKE